MNCIFFPDLRLGEPTKCGSLAVFPLYHEPFLFPERTLDYVLSHEAQEAGACIVREVSPEGRVAELVIENTGKLPVLFVEGEELVGGKQCRVMRSSVLVAAGSQTVVPVYCAERGRWDTTRVKLTTGSHAPPSLRYVLKGSRRSDGQAAVWRFIAAKHLASGTPSPKGNMSDALRAHPDVLKQFQQDLQYPVGASGIAVAMKRKIIGIDLFDRPNSLQKLWDRLVVLGLALDAGDLGDADHYPDKISTSVRLYMDAVGRLMWRRVESAIGLGELYRATGDDGSLAAALVVDGVPIHLSTSAPMKH